MVAMVDEIMEKLKLQARVKKLPLVFEKPTKGFPKVFCDQERIHEVMMNFVDNAIKYTKKGSVVVRLEAKPAFAKATAGRPEGFVTFSVKDTGMPHTNFR